MQESQGLSDREKEHFYNVSLADIYPYSPVMDRIGRDYGQSETAISRIDDLAISSIRKNFPEVTSGKSELEVKKMVEQWYRYRLMMKYKLIRRWTTEEQILYVDDNKLSRNMVIEIYLSQW